MVFSCVLCYSFLCGSLILENAVSIYDLQMELVTGQPLDLSVYRGQVLLIVNTASKCGFARQLKTLSALHDRYHKEGFSMIAVPCNQFSNQEPLDNSALLTYFRDTVNAHFPVLSKQAVDGEDQSALYQWLQAHDPRRFKLTPFIPWNFTKLLIDRNGRLARRFAPVATAAHIEKRLSKYLR